MTAGNDEVFVFVLQIQKQRAETVGSPERKQMKRNVRTMLLLTARLFLLRASILLVHRYSVRRNGFFAQLVVLRGSAR